MLGSSQQAEWPASARTSGSTAPVNHDLTVARKRLLDYICGRTRLFVPRASRRAGKTAQALAVSSRHGGHSARGHGPRVPARKEAMAATVRSALRLIPLLLGACSGQIGPTDPAPPVPPGETEGVTPPAPDQPRAPDG